MANCPEILYDSMMEQNQSHAMTHPFQLWKQSLNSSSFIFHHSSLPIQLPKTTIHTSPLAIKDKGIQLAEAEEHMSSPSKLSPHHDPVHVSTHRAVMGSSPEETDQLNADASKMKGFDCDPNKVILQDIEMGPS